MGIPAAELAALQTAAATTLDQTATIQRNQPTSFNLGQPVENWQNLAGGVNVAARLAAASHALIQQYDSLVGAQQAWVVSFKAAQDVQERDRVVIAGMTLSVQVPLNPSRSYKLLHRVLATQIG